MSEISTLDSRSRVQVSVRIRPLGKADRSDDNVAVEVLPDNRVTVVSDFRDNKLYKFDHVFTNDQTEVFDMIGRPMLEEAYKGFNVCLFAYGQTGSGKTYSLLGDVDSEEVCGVAPRFVRCLYDEAQHLVEEDPELTIKVTVTMIEVYMEKVRDLLAPRQRGQEPESLEIHEDSNRRVFVKGAGVHQVLSAERMMELLKKGNSNRQTGETKMNETSSRSHAIIQINLSQEYQSIEKKDLECVISIVDLAGSERQTKTESSGQQFEEAKKINHSLLMLGRALNSFSDRKGGDAYISLRESKLTRLLSESFGGNSKTWMLATVAPTAYNLTETISTLDYASNAMAITNKVRVNNAFKHLEVKELKSVVAHLEKRLEDLASVKDAKELELAELLEEESALLLAVQGAHSQEESRAKLQNTLNSIHLGNIALRRRVEAASHQLIWSLDNEASFLFYKGRCGVTLENVFLGKRCFFTIGLQADCGTVTSGKLNIQLFPIGAEIVERKDPMELVGKDIHFCLNVVGAEDIPQSFSNHVFCKLALRYDQSERYFTTSTAENTTKPRWGLARQFHIPNLSEQTIRHFCRANIFSFEVFGFSI